MILLDTNVVSEYRKDSYGKADPRVVAWTKAQPKERLFISVITLLEVEKGALIMERRDRRQGAVLRGWIEATLIPSFDGRILPVDERVALATARLHMPNPRPVSDSLIAATAIVHGMTIATRNTGDFKGLPVGLINPWEM